VMSMAELAIVALAVFGSLMQRVLGLAGSMGSEVSAAVTFGLAMSGVMAFAPSLILECIPGSTCHSGCSSMVKTAWLFAFSAMYTAASTWVHHFCFSCQIQEVVNVLVTLEEECSSPMLARARSLGWTSDTLQAGDLPQIQRILKSSMLFPVMRQMWAQAFNIWINYTVYHDNISRDYA